MTFSKESDRIVDVKEDNMHKYRIQRNAKNQDILRVPASRHRVITCCIKKLGGPM